MTKYKEKFLKENRIEREVFIPQEEHQDGKPKENHYNWVSRVALIAIVLCITVIVIVISMLSGEMILSETSPHNESIPPQGGMNQISVRHLTYAKDTVRNEKLNEGIKSSRPFLKNLASFQTKLQMVIDKYAEIEKQENLYSRVKICEFNKCGNLTCAPTSEEEILKILKTAQKFKKRHKYLKYIRKQLPKSLSNFQCQVKNYEQKFQYLIKFEKLPHFKEKDTTNGNRAAVLKELQRELRILRFYSVEDVGIVHGVKGKKNGGMSVNLGEPESQTGLMIKEWKVFSYSKKYLENYNKNIKNLIQNYEEVKKKSRKKKQKKYFLSTNKL